MTESTINKFKIYLKVDHGLGERTIANYLILLRTIFNKAIKDGAVEPKYYPFGKEKVKIKFPESNKIGLTEEEVKILEGLPMDIANTRNQAKNI